jgi:formate hydrogenlyase transcriptional activator
MTSPSPQRIGFAPALFEVLFKSLPDAIIVTDHEGRITETNAQVEQLFGYNRQELIGRPIEILIPERFRDAHRAHHAEFRVQAPRRPMNAGIELYALRKDNSEFPVDIILGSAETADGRMVVCVVRDMSERRKTAETLRQSEERLRLVLESVKDYAIIMLDASGRVASWNPGAETITGYRAEEIVGQHVSHCYTQEDIDAGKPEHELSIAATQGRFEDDGWKVGKNGSRFWANVVTTAIRGKNGDVLGFSRVVRDFTDRKKSDDALLTEISKALLSNLDIQDLLSAISTTLQNAVPHDFATFALHDATTNQFRVHTLRSWQLTAPSPDETVVLPMEGSVAGQVLQTGQPLILNSFRKQTLFPSAIFVHLNSAGLKSGCWIPLINKDRALGTLLVASRREGAFTQQDVNVLSRVASQIAMAVDNAITFREIAQLSDKLAEEKRYLEEELHTEHGFEDIIGENIELRRVLKQVETVAATDVTVLILGETGTGKDLIARAIHQLSSRRERSFAKLNCAAIPTGLLESELFGHEKGAFTGALSQKVGRLELAHEGTIFLDEVGDLPLELQPKILRALQEKEFERLGGTRTIPVNARLIAATNRDLSKMVADREFRSDLYYRLKVFPITLPPLRERREDIPLLVRYFVARHARKLNKRIETIPGGVMKALAHWNWPGNIRELENFIERAVILSRGPVLQVPLSELEVSGDVPSHDDTTLRTTERGHIIHVLRETKGVIAGPRGAAARLGLKRTTLNSKMKKLGISREDYI